MKPYRFHREADAEFTDALNYYSDRAAELGGRFYDEIEQVVAEVCAHPQRFRQIDPPVRRHLVPSFPYCAALHRRAGSHLDHRGRAAEKGPEYWRHRLER